MALSGLDTELPPTAGLSSLFRTTFSFPCQNPSHLRLQKWPDSPSEEEQFVIFSERCWVSDKTMCILSPALAATKVEERRHA